MRKILDSYRKPLLAVFGVVLMIVFILPSSFKGGFDSRNNPVIGHIGSDEVHAAEKATAEKDWDILTRDVVLHTSMPDRPWVPVVAGLMNGQAIDEASDTSLKTFAPLAAALLLFLCWICLRSVAATLSVFGLSAFGVACTLAAMSR